MKVHYINILLFALPLNILLLSSQVSSPRKKPHTTPQHTPTIRLLCECDLYMPNYDNDPQMKKVMDKFNKQTQQRFHEYDDRMKTTRQKCKDRCDKECQKIILKDKLEKELMDKFVTLDTDIQSDAIPTCVCEKSMADKVEKGCLRCGGVLGGGIAPGVWLFGTFAVDQLTSALTATAIAAAKEAGTQAGIQVVIGKMDRFLEVIFSSVKWENFITKSNYNNVSGIAEAVKNAVEWCKNTGNFLDSNMPMVQSVLAKRETEFVKYVAPGTEAYTAEFEAVKAAKLSEVATQTTPLYSAITYSVLAIIIIVLIMVIIYLILRRRRKKKMKKKLQYIKLLEE
ncbi:rifin PIR protein,putative [Plasmodium sp. DRC-Itaito]|nr:rifin PIR protein,putative [Plasmodium sp. DRC-Itaito]